MNDENKNELHSIALKVNGEERTAIVESRMTLADCLRDELGLTGTHTGCEHGVCGACTVLLNNHTARSCLILARQATQYEIRTVEGLQNGDELNILQQSMHDKHGLQCGFCTPGILMTLTELLHDQPHADEVAVREALSGHLCRCTGYQNIVLAAMDALRRQQEGE